VAQEMPGSEESKFKGRGTAVSIDRNGCARDVPARSCKAAVLLRVVVAAQVSRHSNDDALGHEFESTEFIRHIEDDSKLQPCGRILHRCAVTNGDGYHAKTFQGTQPLSLSNLSLPRTLASFCDSVWARLQALGLDAGGRLPKPGDDEQAVIHPFINEILNEVAGCARERRLACNKAFYEHDTVDGGDRPDWLFTQPNEQRHCALNTCFFMETKQVQTLRTNGKTALSVEMLMRAGLAQLMQRLAERHLATDKATQHGIGVVLNGRTVQLLRINFVDDGTDVVFPAFVTPCEPLVGGAGDVACPTGLRWLIALMMEHDVTRFGLPEHGNFDFAEDSPYVFSRVLGQGGFSCVSEVAHGDLALAVKSLRHSKPTLASDALESEAAVLESLATARVPRVPALVARIKSRVGQPGLVLSPVGVPLLDHLTAVLSPARAAFARHVLLHVGETLHAAHAAGFLHGDVRPSNIIMCGDKPYLIDWGFGERTPAKMRKRVHLHGERAFMADDKLRLCDAPPATLWQQKAEHDLHALLYTYAAITQPECAAPWGVAFVGPVATAALLEVRRAWMTEHMVAVSSDLPAPLRGVLAAITTPDARASDV